ncbi:MAG: DinB family protein [Gemmatimonadales bacterium]
MTSLRRPLFAAAAALVAFAATARAQMPESYRELQVRMLETERNMILHMIDSMPSQYFREKATPAQRDFGQQLYHAAVAVKNISAHFMGAPAATYPDTAAGFDKASLRAFVGNVYDAAESFARSEPAADRETMITFFGSQMPKWQVWDELHEHTMWTLGQTVANFRMHGMPPAAFMFF